jgi:hypothetical protein
MTTIVACGILESEVRKVLENLGISLHIEFMPPSLHMYPHELKKELERRLQNSGDSEVLVIYGRCFVEIDDVCKLYGAARIEGENCYEIVAGEVLRQLLKEEPGTYFLLPRLCEEFEQLTENFIIRNRDFLLKNYKRCVFLDTGIESDEKCKKIAETLELSYQKENVGIKTLENKLKDLLKKKKEDIANSMS